MSGLLSLRRSKCHCTGSDGRTWTLEALLAPTPFLWLSNSHLGLDLGIQPLDVTADRLS